MVKAHMVRVRMVKVRMRVRVKVSGEGDSGEGENGEGGNEGEGGEGDSGEGLKWCYKSYLHQIFTPRTYLHNIVVTNSRECHEQELDMSRCGAWEWRGRSPCPRSPGVGDGD